MKLTSIRRYRKLLSASVISALVAGTLVVLAVSSPGFVNSAVNLTDSAVWVTNGQDSLVGRLNRQVDELNSAVSATTNGFDVLQEADDVLVTGSDTLQLLDPVSVSLGAKVALPANGEVSIGAGVVGIADPGTGLVWLVNVKSLNRFDFADTSTAAQLAPGVKIAAGADGTVYAIAPGDSSVTELRLGADGAKPTDRTSPLASAVSTDRTKVALTVVGQTPVVLDQGAAVVMVGSHRIPVQQADTAVLQQPGAATSSVLLATRTALYRIPLDGDSATAVTSDGPDGTPAPPVYLDGCAHAAWNGDAPKYARACGADPATVVEIPKAQPTASFTFRVNRSVIVLNDLGNGNLWMVDHGMALIQDWTSVRPATTDQASDNGDASADSTPDTTPPKCAGQTDLPAPKDNTFEVRAGRSTVLHVLDDDFASACSTFTISSAQGLETADGLVDVVQNGSALQVTVPAGARGALPDITYGVTDGAGHVATAKVALTVVDPAQTVPPKKWRSSVTLVEVGGTVSYNVLGDWYSPVGDDIYLAAATGTTADDEVTYRPDGSITFQDKGTKPPGKKLVNFTISDGTETVDGTMTIDVRATGSTEPYGSPVYARAVVGQPVTVLPLRSVLSPAADPVRLTGVTAQTPTSDITVSSNAGDGTITAVSNKAGTYYFDYQLAAGGKDGTGVLRVDVLDKPLEATPPVTMLDAVYLVDGRSVTVDPTVNDFDPEGGVIAVQAATVPATSPGLTVTTTAMHLLQISATQKLPATGAVVDYVVSNGSASSAGQIRVLPVPVSLAVPAPSASPISVTVRAGDAVTIPINKYAFDPSGEQLTLVPPPSDPVKGAGLLFETGLSIRYLAPTTPPAQPVRFSYTVQNQSGKKSTALVNIQVTAADAPNSAPRAPQVASARVFAGQTVDIEVPLDGIDPDGDWTTLTGIGAATASPLGLATATGTGALRYKAFDAPGLDTITYIASDPYGQQVTGTVKVVVVPAPATAQPPFAPNLEVAVRPARSIGVDVLSEVVDPANKAITFKNPGGIAAPEIWKSLVTVADGVVVVKAPQEPTIQSITYNVVNTDGLPASGLLTVSVDPKATVLPPTAADAFAQRADVKNADANATVTVDVTALITNPSGEVKDLTLAMDPVSAAAATVAERTITVPVLTSRQVLAYTVSNVVDDLTARAFVVIPSRAELGLDAGVQPTLRTDVGPLLVNAGEVNTVKVADYVTVGAAAPEIADGIKPFASQNGVAERIDATTLTYQANENSAGSAVLFIPVAVSGADPVAIGIPVTITPKAIPLPEFAALDLPVEVGTQAVRNLAPLVKTVSAEQAAALSYALVGSVADGFRAVVDGSSLTVDVDAATPKNTVATISVQVTDGPGRTPVTSLVTITAKGSTAPLPRVGDFTIENQNPGTPSTQDVLVGAVDPIGKGLTVTTAVVESGVSAATSVNGSTVSVTPTTVGVVTVRFTVSDVTNDPDRQVTGRLVIQVHAKPETPGTPSIILVGSRSVQLGWTDNADNGLPITGYTVTANGFNQPCKVNPCTLNELTNGTVYNFSVSATNSAGTSAASPPSAPATPNQVPDRPQAPAPHYAGANKLDITWAEPRVDGTAITGYRLSISPADPAGQSTIDVTGTSYTWTGLANGTDYTFSVVAVNAAGPSVSSGPGTAEHPSAPPGAPVNVKVQFGPSQFSAHKLSVSWDAPQDNGGDPVLGFSVTYSSSAGSSSIPLGPDARTADITSVQDGVTYTVVVTATNRSGESPKSEPSTATPFSPPPKVGGVTAAPTGNDGQVAVNWAQVPGQGRNIAGYNVIRLDNNQSRTASASASALIWTGLTNGTDYTFAVSAFYATTSDTSFNQTGPSSDPASANPYGPLGAPVVTSATASGSRISFAWNWPPSNGRPQERIAAISGDNFGGDTSWSADVGYNATRVIALQVCDVPKTGEPRQCKSADPVTVTTGPPPPLTVTPYLLGSADGHIGTSPGSTTCNGAKCRYLGVRVANFPPGSTTCEFGDYAVQVGVNGSGAGQSEAGWYSGRGTATFTCGGVQGKVTW